MPIYEYECGLCRSRFEKRQKYDEAPEAACPKCEGTSRRVFHPTSIIFKGSGFYITDSRKSSTATLSETPKEETASTPKEETASTPKEKTASTPKEETTGKPREETAGKPEKQGK